MSLLRRGILIVLALLPAASALARQQAIAPFTPPAAPTVPVVSPVAYATDVVAIQSITHIEGQGESRLRGIGIITGLKGTGDSGSELVMARPLAEIYKANNNPLPDLKDLAKAKSAAIVFIECIIPAQGARIDDKIDVFVTASHSATSLAGGRLFIAPLAGPWKNSKAYAMASGPIVIEDPATPTAGRIRDGAQMFANIPDDSDPEHPPYTIKESFNLIVDAGHRSFTVTDQIADTINALAPEPDPTDAVPGAGAATTALAIALDDSTIHVDIPLAERANPAKFISRVLTATLSPTLLKAPAKVYINQRTRTIEVSGDVVISPTAIALNDLIVTTTIPTPIPTPLNPQTSTSHWTTVGTSPRPSDRARLADLIQAFRQLDVPIDEQISIITQLHHAGHIHAQLVNE